LLACDSYDESDPEHAPGSGVGAAPPTSFRSPPNPFTTCQHLYSTDFPSSRTLSVVMDVQENSVDVSDSVHGLGSGTAIGQGP